jgi:hypothetical protein
MFSLYNKIELYNKWTKTIMKKPFQLLKMDKVWIVTLWYLAMAFNIPIFFPSISIATVTTSSRLTVVHNYNQKCNLKSGRQQEHILEEHLNWDIEKLITIRSTRVNTIFPAIHCKSQCIALAKISLKSRNRLLFWSSCFRNALWPVL